MLLVNLFITQAFCEQENTPTISLLIPVFNTELFLSDCLDSIIEQTSHDYEVIVVDDCSNDSSSTILEAYRMIMPSLTIIRHTNNKGLLDARKTAVRSAHGKYCCFLDSDDKLASKDSISNMIALTHASNADIIHFQSNTMEKIGDSWKQSKLDYLLPYNGTIIGNRAILEYCFVREKFHHTIWNKLYPMALVKQVYSGIPDIHLVVGEDTYSFFLLAFHAQSYQGILSKPIYTYRIGSGVTKTDDPKKRFITCTVGLGTTITHLTSFTSSQNNFPEGRLIISKLKEDALNTIVYYFTKLEDKDKEEAIDRLKDYFTLDDLKHTLTKHYGWDMSAVDLLFARSNSRSKTAGKRIGKLTVKLAMCSLFAVPGLFIFVARIRKQRTESPFHNFFR